MSLTVLINGTGRGVHRVNLRQHHGEERASIAIATNLPFSEWGTVFPDPRLVAAIVDRVTFNAHILETGTQSYRRRTSKTGRTRNRKPAQKALPAALVN
jgi:hypothetical protein